MPHTAQTATGELIPERRGGVVFSKDISLGNILTLVTMLISVVLGYGRLESRITVLESNEIAREKTALTETAARNQYQSEMKSDMREIRQDIKALSGVVQANSGILRSAGAKP